MWIENLEKFRFKDWKEPTKEWTFIGLKYFDGLVSPTSPPKVPAQLNVAADT